MTLIKTNLTDRKQMIKSVELNNDFGVPTLRQYWEHYNL